LTAAHPDFFLYSGSTWEFDASLHDAACAPLDLTGAGIAWNLYDGTRAVRIALVIGDGITVINATGGLCKITVGADLTAALAQGTYRDEIVVTLATGAITTQAVGTIMCQKPGSLPVPPAAAQVMDPCATLAALQSARVALLSGQRVMSVSIEGFSIQYGAGDMNALERAISNYDELCRKATGANPRRFAIGSGAGSRTY
jgi:hypothetical protein